MLLLCLHLVFVWEKRENMMLMIYKDLSDRVIVITVFFW